MLVAGYEQHRKKRQTLFNVFKHNGILNNSRSHSNSTRDADELEKSKCTMDIPNRDQDDQTIDCDHINNNTDFGREFYYNGKKQLEKPSTKDCDEYTIDEGPNHKMEVIITQPTSAC